MRNIKRRILSLALSAVVACMSFGTTAFAAEPTEQLDATCYNVELTSEGITSITDQNGNTIDPYSVTRSSISGYESDTSRIIIYIIFIIQLLAFVPLILLLLENHMS